MLASRHWHLPDTHNIRDLGGYARTGGGSTQWGRILRAEALHSLTELSREELVTRGLSLVIDLRGPHETAITDHPFAGHPKVEYRNIVLFDALAPLALARSPVNMAERYCEALDRCRPRFAEVLRSIASAPPGLVLFHCTAGKDRTGVVAALLLSIAGVSATDILEDYSLTASAHELMGQLRSQALASGVAPDHVESVLASDARTMAKFLAHLEQSHGGVAAYLDRIGLAHSEVQLLADRLCS